MIKMNFITNHIDTPEFTGPGYNLQEFKPKLDIMGNAQRSLEFNNEFKYSVVDKKLMPTKSSSRATHWEFIKSPTTIPNNGKPIVREFCKATQSSKYKLGGYCN